MFSWIGRFLNSSIGKKTNMAISGLLLVGFLIVHLSGNLLLTAGDEGAKFDGYAQKLHDLGPLLYVAEMGLLALFGVHIAFGIRATWQNRQARPGKYAVNSSHGQKTLASSSMAITGVIVLIFMLLHLIDFRFDGDFKGLFGENRGAGAADFVLAELAEPLHAGIYLVGVLALTIHLSHAIQSAFQTLGLRHPKLFGPLRVAALGLTIVLGLGFAALPVYALLQN
ncbi:MAG: succinate dehydrogenase cytochrome b subunit [Planctomycetota bacterium]|jgi:succinate dehydrogenase / fumarate reductase cytochrome b subunit